MTEKYEQPIPNLESIYTVNYNFNQMISLCKIKTKHNLFFSIFIRNIKMQFAQYGILHNLIDFKMAFPFNRKMKCSKQVIYYIDKIFLPVFLLFDSSSQNVEMLNTSEIK